MEFLVENGSLIISQLKFLSHFYNFFFSFWICKTFGMIQKKISQFLVKKFQRRVRDKILSSREGQKFTSFFGFLFFFSLFGTFLLELYIYLMDSNINVI